MCKKEECNRKQCDCANNKLNDGVLIIRESLLFKMIEEIHTSIINTHKEVARVNELKALLYEAHENLSNLPISSNWANEWCERADEISPKDETERKGSNDKSANG